MNVPIRRWANLTVIRSASLASAKAVKTPTPESEVVFGDLSESGRKTLELKSAEALIPDDPDGYDKEEFDLEPRKNAYYYKYEITKFARRGATGIRRALELFQEMKSKGRLEPTIDNFSPLIYGCAKAGYTKRAFELYEESLRYLAKPSNSVVTCLINACAESPFSEYGLERLKWFLTHIRVNYNRTLNEVQYNSAIKAYGKLGQLDEASRLVQEMIDNEIYPTIDTFNMLLIGCASNRQAGCSFALRVYKRIKMYGMKPNIVTYRLMLRCIRDCGMGSQELLTETIDELPAMTSLSQRLEYQKKAQKSHHPKKKFTSNFAWTPLLTDMGKSFAAAVKESGHRDNGLLSRRGKFENGSKTNLPDLVETGSSMVADNDDHTSRIVAVPGNGKQLLPNLLDDDHLNLMLRIKAIQVEKLRHGADRLLLFGGLHGYLGTMMEDDCKPDNKTFSLLLECLEPTKESHLEYHRLAQELNITRDLVYYDLLIRHICHNGADRERLSLALYFVEQMHLDNLRPNISTFEALAGGCNSWYQASKLITDVERCGFIVSEVMIAEFFRCARSRLNFDYLGKLIDHCRRIEFSPTKNLVDKLENLRLWFGEKILQQEKECGSSARAISDRQVQNFDAFKYKLARWLKSVDLREDDHPWAQFRVEYGSKNQGYQEYVKHLKTATQLKSEALKTGGHLGNLFYKAKKSIVEAQD